VFAKPGGSVGDIAAAVPSSTSPIRHGGGQFRREEISPRHWRQFRRRAGNATQQDGAQFRGEKRTHVRRPVEPVEAGAETRACSQVLGVEDVNDAPQIERAVLERRAGQREQN